MRVDSARFVPALFDFPEADARQTCWGRFLELAAHSARLITVARLAAGDPLTLTFDLPQEKFEGLQARVLRAWTDADGYFVAELRFVESEERRRLGRALTRILSSV